MLATQDWGKLQMIPTPSSLNLCTQALLNILMHNMRLKDQAGLVL